MAKRPVSRKASTNLLEVGTGVVVGWTHHDLGSSIDLRIQSAQSKLALNNDEIDSHHFLMTHNQALLLAKYLLDATGQILPAKQKPALWRRIGNSFRK
ncbi:MAG: hypothetical protein ABI668_11880 [Sphingorhabdus sp.]